MAAGAELLCADVSGAIRRSYMVAVVVSNYLQAVDFSARLLWVKLQNSGVWITVQYHSNWWHSSQIDGNSGNIPVVND